jgi:signal recognition particle subunit SRP54
MMPGIGSALKDLPIDDKQIDRTLAIIGSMTPTERRKPALIDLSRRRRIARGAGVHVDEVGKLLKSFDMSNKMMRMMPALQGMAGAGGFTPRMNPQQAMEMMRSLDKGSGSAPDKPKYKVRKKKK